MNYGDYMDREGPPLSSIDLAFQRSRGGPSTVRGATKRTPTGRPRGRPPKKPRKEEFDPSDTSESEVEEVLPESAGHSSGDENDPDWRVGQSMDDLPKRLKTKINYNIKTLMQTEITGNKGTGSRPRGRPRGSFKSVASPRLGQVIMDDSDKRELDFFISKLPDPAADPPGQTQRQFGSQMDALQVVVNSSGGFRHFVRALNDEAIIEIYTHVNGRYIFPEINCEQKDAIQIVQCLRHMWNCLPNQMRTNFEHAARKKATDDYKNGGTDDGEVPSSLADLMEKALVNKVPDGHPSMPVSETPFRGASKSTGDMVASDCCSNTGLLKNFNDLKRHFMNKHYTGYLYACHFCSLLHESKEQLLKHSCEGGFSDFMINRLVAGVVDDPQMTAAYMYLTCFECGFWLPLRDYKGERLEQAWNFFVTTNNHHCGESLRLLIVFSLEPIKERMEIKDEGGEKPNSFLINIVPRLRGIKASCEDCSVEFKTADEANDHMLQHVQHTCTKCGAQFGTEAHLAHHHHQAGHISNKILFARYIRDNLTVYPPVHVKNAMPRVGFADSGTVAYGGKEFTEENLFEFVNNGEAHLQEKLHHALHSVPLDPIQEEMEGYCARQGRHDMGHEEEKQIDQPTSEQAQLIETMNKLFAKQIPEKRKLQWNAKLHNMEKMRDAFCQEVNDMNNESELEAKELKCPMNYFVEDVIRTFSTTVRMPILACFDAISEALLTKDFDLCTDCNKIFELNGAIVHNCPSESVVPIHRWQEGRRTRVSCHLCNQAFCSIFTLRSHYACDHLLVVDIESKKRDNLMAMAMKKGSKSTISKITDAALHMEATRGLLRPKLSTGVQHMAMSVPMRVPPQRIYPTYRKSGYTPIASRSSVPLLVPYTPCTHRPGYNCKFCTFMVPDMRKMREHLRTCHSVMCRGCGIAFVDEKTQKEHKTICSEPFKYVSMGNVQGTCIACNKKLHLPRLYTHIFEEHLQMVGYGAEDGRIYAKDTGSFFVKDIQGPSGGPALTARGMPSLTAAQNISCYLCGFEFDTLSQLKEHLDRHPEKWDRCPYCPSVVIRSHDDFKQHLMVAHYNHVDNSMICKACQQVTDKNNIAHVLYSCIFIKRCPFCTFIRSDQGADELRGHLKTAHPRLFSRFQCSECKMTNPQLQLVKSHTCKVYDMSHHCECGEILSNRSVFVDHFWKHIDTTTQCCKLCAMTFNTGHTIASHRLTHGKVLGKSTNRKIKIIDEELFTGKAKHHVEQPPQPRAIQRPRVPIEVVDLDNDDCEVMEVDSNSPAVGKESDEKIAKAVVRQLVKDVCAQMGEEEEEENALTAHVRMESDDVTVVNQHPGYVDDDTECHSPSTLIAGTSVLREINEDNNDDDICVVAEVDHPLGSIQSTVVASSSRAKKFKCSKCSEAFVTQGSLVDHEIRSHRNDVGGVQIKTYGAPTEGVHYVCRNCSLLFESPIEHRSHMSAHGPNPGMSCPDCSAFSYNTPLLVQHKNCHARQDKGRLLYGCGCCNRMFLTDARLYHHLQSVHDVLLLFFCKACSMTSYSMEMLLQHVQKSNVCKAFLNKQGCKFNQMMGYFPANMVHFQPTNQEVFEMKLRHGQVTTITPSDCSHRSFLTPTDSVMSCKECHCTMPSVSFYANETYKNGGVPLNLPVTIDESRAYPFADMGVLPRTRAPYTTTLRGRPPSTARLYGQQSLTAPSPSNRMPGATANVVSVGRPRNQFALARGSLIQSNQGMAASNMGVRNVGPGRPSLSAQLPYLNGPVSNKCEVCHATMTNPKVRRLHELHTSGQEWFCLNCATGQKTEMDAVSHAFVCGFNEERRDQIASQPDFRPITFNLLCPFDQCRRKESKDYFSSLPEMRAHINQFHERALPYHSLCGQKFATRETQLRHEAEHKKYDDLGIQTSCCNLCGVGNQWNQTTEICSHRTVISHLATHGLHAYSMCRGCFTCFPHDYDFSKTTKHFEAAHTKAGNNGNQYRCLFCDIVIKKSELKAHVQEKHIVRGYKPRYNSSYQLIVRTSGVTRQFMGMPTEGFEEEAEPSSTSAARS